MSKFEDFLTRLVKSYKGNKIAIAAAGGGASLARIALVPGSSGILEEVNILYSEDATHTYIERAGYRVNDKKVVSLGIGGLLHLATAQRLQDSCHIIAMTSALTTSRPRKGDNQAYIYVDGEPWHIELDKLPESVYSDSVIPWRDQQIAYKRQSEDELISEVALKLVTGFERDTLEGMISNGVLRSL